MSRLAIGPKGKLDIANRQFIASDPRRPASAPGVDQAWLWQRASVYASRYIDSVPDAGSTGPDWWEPPLAWGVTGSLLRKPKVLFISALDNVFSAGALTTAPAATALRNWLNDNFTGVLAPLGVSAFIADTISPFLAGCPFDHSDFLPQDGGPVNPRTVFVPPVADLFRGGKIFNAVFTTGRAVFGASVNPAGQPDLSDYTLVGNDSTPYPGYDFIPDSAGPLPNEGFYVASGPAAEDLAKLVVVAGKCDKWQTVFYQGQYEYIGIGVGATNSSLITEGALNALLDPTLTRRVPFSATTNPDGSVIYDYNDAINKMLSDALTFFS